MNRNAVPNRIMITHINDVLGISMRKLCISIDIPVNTFTHWTERGIIRIPELVRICNLYLIPFRCFLCFDGEEPAFKSYKEVSVPKERFTPVTFHYERIKKCGRDCTPRMKVADITEKIGICFNTFSKFYNEEDAVNFTVDYFLKLCEVTGLPMKYFLDDESYLLGTETEENTDELKERQKQEVTTEENEIVLSLKEENRLLKKQIRILQKRMDDMERKFSRQRKPVKPVRDYSPVKEEKLNAADPDICLYRRRKRRSVT